MMHFVHIFKSLPFCHLMRWKLREFFFKFVFLDDNGCTELLCFRGWRRWVYKRTCIWYSIASAWDCKKRVFHQGIHSWENGMNPECFLVLECLDNLIKQDKHNISTNNCFKRIIRPMLSEYMGVCYPWYENDCILLLILFLFCSVIINGKLWNTLMAGILYYFLG